MTTRLHLMNPLEMPIKPNSSYRFHILHTNTKIVICNFLISNSIILGPFIYLLSLHYAMLCSVHVLTNQLTFIGIHTSYNREALNLTIHDHRFNGGTLVNTCAIFFGLNEYAYIYIPRNKKQFRKSVFLVSNQSIDRIYILFVY